MSDLRANLRHVIDRLAEVETKARELSNQNFADLIGLARGRLVQACEHPDIDRVGRGENERNAMRAEDPNLNSGGNAFFAASDPGAAAAHEEARRRDLMAVQPQQDAALSRPASDDGKHPGDPAFDFQRQNPDFKHPDNITLNDDGTVKHAPNVFGTADDRDK